MSIALHYNGKDVFNVTQAAVSRIMYLASKEDISGAVLRVIVEGGGCFGFQYRFDIDWLNDKDCSKSSIDIDDDEFDFGNEESDDDDEFDFGNEESDDDDLVIRDIDGRGVVVFNKNSLNLLSGSTLDYVEELGAAFFTIRNPNAKGSCGCGNSFSVEGDIKN